MSASPYLNRELSWLEFNQRVLDEAADPSVPLAERIKFTAITSKNLDEFFMVRVGGLTKMARAGTKTPDPAGLSPAKQLEKIHTRIQKMTHDQHALWEQELIPLMDDAGIRNLPIRDLNPEQRSHIDQVFEREIFPILTPMILEDGPSAPRLTNQTIYIGSRLQPIDEDSDVRVGVVPMSSTLPRRIPVPSPGRFDYVLLDDLIEHYIDRFFVGSKILETVRLRVT